MVSTLYFNVKSCGEKGVNTATYKGFLILPTIIPLQTGGCSVEGYILFHDGNSIDATKFFDTKKIYPNEADAEQAFITAAKSYIDGIKIS